MADVIATVQNESVQVTLTGAEAIQPLLARAETAAATATADANAAAQAAADAVGDAPFVTGPGLAVTGEAVDDDGYAGFGVDRKGDFWASLSDETRGFCEIIHPTVLVGFVDQDGYVGDALGVDGLPLADARPFAVFESGASPNREILAIDAEDRIVTLTHDDGDNHSPGFDAGDVRWVNDSSGTLSYRSADLALAPTFDAAITRLVHVVGYGQSNSIGYLAAGLDTAALDTGFAYQFPGSIVPGASNNAAYVLGDDRLGLIEDLIGPSREGYGALGPRAMHGLLTETAASDAVLWSGHGVAGQTYALLKKGTQPWSNMRQALLHGARQAWAAGVDYTIKAMVWVQGENNYAEFKATYLAHMEELHTDFRTDARAIARDAALETPIFIVQPSSWTKYGAGAVSSGVPLGQMQAMLDHPGDFYVVMPMYVLTHQADGIHSNAAGFKLMDEYVGRALASVEAGGSGAGLYALSAVRVGTDVTVSCSVPSGNLAIDTSLVSDPGQYGLVYRDGGGANVAISSIAVSGDEITFTLASAVAGTLSFGCEGTIGNAAGPTTGPRCCIRDSSADVSSAGTAMHNYMLHCSVAVA